MPSNNALERTGKDRGTVIVAGRSTRALDVAMKVHDGVTSVRFLLRSALDNLITLAVNDGATFVWQVVNVNFQLVTGEVVQLEGPFKLTVTQLPPELLLGEQSVANEEFVSAITYGQVPAAMWQILPATGEPPLLIAGKQYSVFARSWKKMERARFDKA